MNQLVTGCVSVLGGGLPCPGFGRVSNFANRSTTGCVPGLLRGIDNSGILKVFVNININMHVM